MELDTQQQELLDKFPYMQELCRRIDTINREIESGYSGIEPAYNLLTDLPADWVDEVDDRIQKISNDHKKSQSHCWELFNAGRITTGIRKKALLENDKLFARRIKSIVVGIMNKKGILLMTRQKVENNVLSQLDMEVEDEQ